MTQVHTVRGLTKLWRPISSGSDTSARPGSSQLARGYEPLTTRVLEARGLLNEESEKFLAPRLAHLHDPSLLPDMDRAAERILHAAASQQPIAIYGDYDVDGVTASAIIARTLTAIHPETRVITYIPHRIDEGYGLNADAIRSLAEAGAAVIVTVDCGITATGPAMLARDLGIDLIITDHHNGAENEADLPPAYAIVHPRRPRSAYPFADLCGAGVAYKLAWRLCTMHAASPRLPQHLRDLLVELLALAALGAIADVVPLLGENRVIVRSGLPRIRSSPFIGLRALVKASGLDGDRIDTDAVGFSLAPRLNACGRLGHAREALELMLTDDPLRAAEIARDLTRLNDNRRTVEKQIAEQALELAAESGMLHADTRAIVLAHPEWHTGVIGIVCSRLVERTGRPTILLQHQGQMLAGSGRSIDGYSLHAALSECSPYLHTFGGHDMAAGLKLTPDKLDAFRDAFTSHASRLLNPEDLIPRVQFDCDASIRDLTPLAIRQLELLAPFGRENPPVRVRLSGLRVSARPEPFGKAGAHIKLTLREGERSLRVIGWNWASRHPQTAASIPVGTRIDALVIPKLSTWSGLVEPELVDLQPG